MSPLSFFGLSDGILSFFFKLCLMPLPIITLVSAIDPLSKVFLELCDCCDESCFQHFRLLGLMEGLWDSFDGSHSQFFGLIYGTSKLCDGGVRLSDGVLISRLIIFVWKFVFRSKIDY